MKQTAFIRKQYTILGYSLQYAETVDYLTISGKGIVFLKRCIGYDDLEFTFSGALPIIDEKPSGPKPHAAALPERKLKEE